MPFLPAALIRPSFLRNRDCTGPEYSSIVPTRSVSEANAPRAIKKAYVVPDKGSVNDLRMTVNSTESTNSINSTTSGVYPTRKGEILVTTDPYMGSVPSGHAAIVYNREFH